MVESRIKQLRLEKGLTQTKLAILSQIDQSSISKLENGTRYFSLEQLYSLSLVLGTSTDFLLGLTDEKNPYPRSQAARKRLDREGWMKYE